MGLIVITPVKRRRNGQYDDVNESRRQNTIWFSLPDGNGDVVQVCKNTFMQVFAITKRRIETLVSAKKKGEVVFTEKRGNKAQRSKFTAADVDLVTEHVNSFPRDESHYGRRKSNKEYLSQDLNINRLYLAYKEKYSDSNVTYKFYYKTFKTKFPHVSFHRPRTDTCSKCDLLSAEILAKPGDRTTKTALQLHHRKSEKAREVMKQDTISSQLPTSNESMCSIDLEQVLSLPFLTHGQMFYSRQLSCFNLCVHVGDNNKGLMFLWHEGMSGRGGNEIASCLFNALTSPAHNNIMSKRILTVWSDNCIGQNKNKMILFLWIYLTIIGKYDEINHKFLVSGHSYLPCDRDFAQIEKRKRVEKCQVPTDLIKLMVNATPNNPFIVTMLQPDDFIDFKQAADLYINTTKLNISKCSWIKIEKNGVVKTKTTLNELETWNTCKVLKKGITTQKIKDSILPTLPCHNSISAEKKRDLQQMLPYLKEENRAFYEELIK